MNYDDLNAMFPAQTHFYEVVGLSMSEALDRCARLTGGAAHVTTVGGSMVVAVQHELSSDISFLRAVPGAPAPEADPTV